MNVTDMADLLGVSPATVSRICSGDRRPSLNLILKINREMGWSVEDQAMLLAESTSAYGDRFRVRMERHRPKVTNGLS